MKTNDLFVHHLPLQSRRHNSKYRQRKHSGLNELEDLFGLRLGYLIHLTGRHLGFGIVEQRHANHR